jgi:hypothetical protein
MIPFEQLRSIVRRATDERDLVLEAAACLALFGDADAPDLVTASRQLLHHRPDCIPLWWLCARVLAAPEPSHAARTAERELREDPTAQRLTGLLPFPHDDAVAVLDDSTTARAAVEDRPDLDAYAVRRPSSRTRRRSRPSLEDDLARFDGERPFGPRVSHVLFDALGGCGDRLLVSSGVATLLDEIGDGRTVCWTTLTLGRALPARLFDVAIAAMGDLRGRGLELLDPARCDRIAGPTGLDPPERLRGRADCPATPELFRLG